MDNNHTAAPHLILIRGLPGSGKSFIADALKHSLGAANAITLDPDATDYDSQEYQNMSATLSADGVHVKFHPYRFLRAQAYAAIDSGKTIIWNQAFTNLDSFNKTVVNLQAYAADHDRQLPVLVVEVTIDEAVARARVMQREAQGGHGVPAENFARFVSDYHSFANQGYNMVTVNGAGDVTASVAAIEQALAA